MKKRIKIIKNNPNEHTHTHTKKQQQRKNNSKKKEYNKKVKESSKYEGGEYGGSGYGGSAPGPDCTKCGLVNGDVNPSSSYAINTWTVCGPGCTGDTPANNCQVMTSYGVFVHSHRCACGWHPNPELIPCNFGDIYEAFASSLSSLPGVIDGIISSGGAIGL